ncbi:MAG: triose-phosphate isomerase [Ruminococcus sp.]|nr:triose-phosphate isomerase [Ruminococcus sp.]
MKKLRVPFFEIGPKAYLYGEEALKLAKTADELAEEYEVDIIFTAQYTDIRRIADATKNIRVFAQHMDSLKPGRGVGAVLPEALKEAGAEGVLLNHAEKPLTITEISRCIERAKEVGLISMVCAANVKEARMIAALEPDIILAEAPELIGKGSRSKEDAIAIEIINEAVHSISENIQILHGAGIQNENDVYEIIHAGAQATGSTSGIILAESPEFMLKKMIKAVATAWKQRKKEEEA